MRYVFPTIFFACAAALSLQPAVADVYKYRDAQGRIYLTDTPMKGNYRLLKRFNFGGNSSSTSSDSLAKMRQRRDNLAPLIEAAAVRRSAAPAIGVWALVASRHRPVENVIAVLREAGQDLDFLEQELRDSAAQNWQELSTAMESGWSDVKNKFREIFS